MILTTHGIVGAAAAVAVTSMSPSFGMVAIGTIVAFASHFALDTIPHWDYKLRSVPDDEDANTSIALNQSALPLKTPLVGAFRFTLDRNFKIDVAKVFVDAVVGGVLGVMIALALPPASLFAANASFFLYAAILGAGAAMLPDFFHFLSLCRPQWKWLAPIMRYHKWNHTATKLRGDRAWLGIASQIAILVIIVAVLGAII